MREENGYCWRTHPNIEARISATERKGEMSASVLKEENLGADCKVEKRWQTRSRKNS